jgi:ribosomal protein S6
MTQLYEGMFLLDNQVVREDWGRAKAVVTDALAKHGANVLSARRWDERRLTYPIRGRKRATYLLTYFEQDGQRSQALRHDLEIDERVLRYLILGAEALPAGEVEKSQAEQEEGFSVPPPPTDEEPVAVAEAPAEADDSDDDGDDDAAVDAGDDDGEEVAAKVGAGAKPSAKDSAGAATQEED